MSEKLEAVATSAAPAALGAYSQAVKANGFVFVSGQLGIDMETGKLAEGVEAQARASMRNVGEILTAAGASYGAVVKTTIFVKDLAGFKTVNTVYAEFFDGVNPARSCVQVAALPMGGLVEIEAVAMVEA